MQLREYQDHFERLIHLEQEEEMRRHKQEMENLSGAERERRGRCLLDMQRVKSSQGVGGEHRVTFQREDGDPLPDTDLSVGDLVQVSRDQPLARDNPTGTVWEKSRRSLTVSFRDRLPGWTRTGGLRIDLYVDNITFQRMLDALFLLPGLSHEKQGLLEVILENRNPTIQDRTLDLDWVNERLNPSQKWAVESALNAREVFLIHGPPGTGKTVTITEVIAQAVRRGAYVLATAESNVAVDNLLEQLLRNDVQAVRVGHPARSHPSLRDNTLDFMLEENDRYNRSQRKRQQAFDLIEQRRELTSPSGRWRRGMSNETIRRLAARGEGNRGVSADRIQEMADYLELSDRIDTLFEDCDRLEEEAIQEVLTGVDVVCATNSTSGSGILGGLEFDYVCVDEATQATEPSCLIPATKGHKLVMAGDHRQLPPTILNEEARDAGMNETLFERLITRWEDRISKRLRRQYRMHEDIMDYPSRRFYDSDLVADSSVRDHTLGDLDRFQPDRLDPAYEPVLSPRPVLVWLDTVSLHGRDRQRPGSTSHANPTEAGVVLGLLEQALRIGLKPDDLAIITPYQDQLDILRTHRPDERVEVNTVDGFQGREKEVVMVSFVRSNPEGTVGFLGDPRRLNVTLTRARRKLILVGDTATLVRGELYGGLLETVKDRGNHRVLDESSPLITDPPVPTPFGSA